MTAENEPLRNRLAASGIDLSLWGTGAAKTVEHLAREIAKGETELAEVNGTIVRQVVVASADVTYRDAAGTLLRLREEMQEFPDGRTRVRTLDTTMGEKLAVGEDPLEGIRRGIQEELGIAEAECEPKGTEVREEQSPSYPGLLTRYVFHRFIVRIDRAQFRPEGYVEQGSNLTTYFVWEAATTD